MKTLIKKCPYCGKEINSLYKKQLDYNLQAHELACIENPKNNKRRREDDKL